MINKIVLAIVLTIATLATVPASAGPYCQEDLRHQGECPTAAEN